MKCSSMADELDTFVSAALENMITRSEEYQRFTKCRPCGNAFEYQIYQRLVIRTQVTQSYAIKNPTFAKCSASATNRIVESKLALLVHLLVVDIVRFPNTSMQLMQQPYFVAV